MEIRRLFNSEGRKKFEKDVERISVELLSCSLHGENAKIQKPKILRHAKTSWSERIIGRTASFFEMGDEIFIKMGELFCREMSFSEPIDMMLPLSALAKKYPKKLAKIGNRGELPMS